jgi:AmmeMemoRadiSam system protein A
MSGASIPHAGRESSSPAPDDPVVALARDAVESCVQHGPPVEARLPVGVGPARAGVFVSLHGADGSLRGCLGTFLPTKATLAEEIVANAASAATRDPRFFPVSRAELSGLQVSVDVLGEPEEVAGPDELDPRRFGLIVRADDGRQALLLPDLAGVDTVERQLELTCRKGGINPLRDRYRLYRFLVVRHEEPSHRA